MDEERGVREEERGGGKVGRREGEMKEVKGEGRGRRWGDGKGRMI